MSEIDRRDFLKLIGVGAGATAAAGCSELPEKLIPYVIQPEEIIPGIPVIYASTCQECSAGCGLHVKTREGRPIKLEGNPEHPINRGRLCARGQAGIERTYHPDRYASPMLRGADGSLAPITWDEAIAMLAGKLRAAGGRTQILTGATGPTLGALIQRFAAAVGAGGTTVYEPFAHESLRAAAKAAFGIDTRPSFSLAGADYVLDLGSEYLEAWLSPTQHAREIADGRDILAHPDGGAHVVAFGPRLSLSVDNSDEWLPAKPGSEGVLALGIARAVAEKKGLLDGSLAALLSDYGAEAVAAKTGVAAADLRRIAAAVAAAKSPVALPPGTGLTSRRATAANSAVMILNLVIGAIGSHVQLDNPADVPGSPGSYRDIVKLIDAMKSGSVAVLLVHGSNPVYSTPADSGFAAALEKVAFVVSTASMPDETSAKAHLVLPDNTPLESWGDAAPRVGVRSIVQPTIRPLFDSQSVGDTLLATARVLGGGAAAAMPEGSFRGVLEAAWSDVDWRAAVARGGVFSDDSAGVPVALSAGVGDIEFREPELEGSGEFIVYANPSPLLGDGSGANLSWLQETPDPVTGVSWQSWAEISRNAAERLGIDTGDVLAVKTPFGTLNVPAFPRGGLRDDVIAIATGQGHTAGLFASLANDGRPGEARGVDVAALLPAHTDESGGRAWLTTRAQVTPTGEHARLPMALYTDNKRGRQLGDAISLVALAKSSKAAGEGHGAAAVHADPHGGGHAEAHEIRRPYDAADDSKAESSYRWGMNIDLDRCNGCSACIVACSIENNIPTVGEEASLRHRQMTWLRIERYVGDGFQELRTGRPSRIDHEELGKLDVRHSPMMCQQCGAAPCEPVCPVIATYHADDGLNAMTYNRCIGTRYCANNCPYKVRRFNWFDYSIENLPEPTRLRLNPDVTVRGQGVMEKCTYCVQRIASARQFAKDENRLIRPGEVTPACAQTCPTSAITFGNLKDPASDVVKEAEANSTRSYHALHVLNTRPATTYLMKVMRNGEEA